jgi:hypothetical protein
MDGRDSGLPRKIGLVIATIALETVVLGLPEARRTSARTHLPHRPPVVQLISAVPDDGRAVPDLHEVGELIGELERAAETVRERVRGRDESTDLVHLIDDFL